VIVGVAGRPSLFMRAFRALAITLLFSLVGPVIELTLYTILFLGYAVSSSGLNASLEGVYWMKIWFFGSWGLGWRVLRPNLVQASLVGLVVSLYEMLRTRVSGWTMLAISVVSGILWFLWAIENVIAVVGWRTSSLWMLVGIQAVNELCFVASMMACWKIVRIVSFERTAAAEISSA
jgi:hypothetical protein